MDGLVLPMTQDGVVAAAASPEGPGNGTHDEEEMSKAMCVFLTDSADCRILESLVAPAQNPIPPNLRCLLC